MENLFAAATFCHVLPPRWPAGPAGGGLGWGDGVVVSAIAPVAFIALVAYVAVTKRDVQPRRAGRGASHLHVPHPHLEGAPRPQAAES